LVSIKDCSVRYTLAYRAVFRVGAGTRVCGGFSWISPTSFASAAHWMKKSALINATFAMATLSLLRKMARRYTEPVSAEFGVVAVVKPLIRL
jgi:hypothetical protein